MCEWKGDFSHQKLLEVNGLRISADTCLYNLLKSLNENGLETVAHCCGHGNVPGTISLKDGREIIIAKDYREAREMSAIRGLDIHGNKIITKEIQI